MGTTTKTIRLDERFLYLVEDYTKVMKMMFGSAPTVNSVLNDSIIRGFSDSLELFRFLSTHKIEAEGNESFNDEIREKIVLILNQYDELYGKPEKPYELVAKED